MPKKARDTVRVNFNLPAETVEKIDDYANRMNINRTTAVIVLCNQMLDSMKATESIKELSKALDDMKALHV